MCKLVKGRILKALFYLVVFWSSSTIRSNLFIWLDCFLPFLMYDGVSYFTAGLREYFSQTDERPPALRIPVMVNMASASVSLKKGDKLYGSSVHRRSMSVDQMTSSNKNASIMDEYSDEEEDFQVPDQEVCIIDFCTHCEFSFPQNDLWRIYRGCHQAVQALKMKNLVCASYAYSFDLASDPFTFNKC